MAQCPLNTVPPEYCDQEGKEGGGGGGGRGQENIISTHHTTISY